MNAQSMPMPPHGLMGPLADDHTGLWLYALLLWAVGLLVVGFLIYWKKQKQRSKALINDAPLDPKAILKDIELSLQELSEKRSELPQEHMLVGLSQNVKGALQVGRLESVIGMTNQELMDWIEHKAAMPAVLKSSIKTFYSHADKVIYRGEKLDDVQMESLISLSRDVVDHCSKQFDESV